jgi:hypothetical protein
MFQIPWEPPLTTSLIFDRHFFPTENYGGFFALVDKAQCGCSDLNKLPGH